MVEVRAFPQRYRINTLRVFGAISFGFLALTSAPPDFPLVNSVVALVGLLAILTAIAGRVWSLFYIVGRKNSELLTVGPYSITRNPLYLFSLIGIAGVGAQTESLLSMVAMTGVAYIAFDIAMRGEEARLADMVRALRNIGTRRRGFCRIFPYGARLTIFPFVPREL